MPITIEQYNRMCAYFDGEMLLEEEKAFLEEIENDPELKKEFEWEEKIIFNSVPDAIEQQLIASDNGVREISKPVDVLPSIQLRQQGRRIGRIILAAACTGILALLLVNVIQRKSPPVSKDLITKENKDDHKPGQQNDSSTINHLPAPNHRDQQFVNQELLKRRKRVNALGRHQPDLVAESPLLGEVQVAFADENYADVEYKADHISPTRGDEPDKENIKVYVIFYKGISNIELNKDSIALVQLSDVVKKSATFPALAKEARWNMAKAYYKLSQMSESRNILQKLSLEKAFPFKKDVAKLLLLTKE